jgi:hypothetical protein
VGHDRLDIDSSSRGRQAMAKVIMCEDGFLIRGASDGGLVAKAEAHVRDAHPELVGTLSRDKFLVMAKEVSP